MTQSGTNTGAIALAIGYSPWFKIMLQRGKIGGDVFGVYRDNIHRAKCILQVSNRLFPGRRIAWIPWRAIAILAKLHRYYPPQLVGIPRNRGEEMLSSLQEDFNIWVKSVKLKSQVIIEIEHKPINGDKRCKILV
ncbi:hypothetical protein [Phormidium sp. CCY1219]|uniref:hypothetical protein n=1 Tax=Phormidium sp. CCY1219 TaxID=2886104 RepID=UPI002D1F726B|nr:hypothetical protein [Phormidium sp. CCY1219]MEB3830683.1 hypothetical protein [Phormidium sp. CCY1219]